MVSTFRRNPSLAIERVDQVERIEKCERFVYSIDSGNSLKWKGLPKDGAVNPFFGTRSQVESIKINHVNRLKAVKSLRIQPVGLTDG